MYSVNTVHISVVSDYVLKAKSAY